MPPKSPSDPAKRPTQPYALHTGNNARAARGRRIGHKDESSGQEGAPKAGSGLVEGLLVRFCLAFLHATRTRMPAPLHTLSATSHIGETCHREESMERTAHALQKYVQALCLAAGIDCPLGACLICLHLASRARPLPFSFMLALESRANICMNFMR